MCYAEPLEMWERKGDRQMQMCSQRKEPLIWVLSHKQEFVKCAGWQSIPSLLTGLRVIQTPGKNSISCIGLQRCFQPRLTVEPMEWIHKIGHYPKWAATIHSLKAWSEQHGGGRGNYTHVHTHTPSPLPPNLPPSSSLSPSQNWATVFLSFGSRTPDSLTSVPLALN